ncbi:uncharacterized protein V6R79_003642 [Siganus canaliculatus]
MFAGTTIVHEAETFYTDEECCENEVDIECIDECNECLSFQLLLPVCKEAQSKSSREQERAKGATENMFSVDNVWNEQQRQRSRNSGSDCAADNVNEAACVKCQMRLVFL